MSISGPARSMPTKLAGLRCGQSEAGGAGFENLVLGVVADDESDVQLVMCRRPQPLDAVHRGAFAQTWPARADRARPASRRASIPVPSPRPSRDGRSNRSCSSMPPAAETCVPVVVTASSITATLSGSTRDRLSINTPGVIGRASRCVAIVSREPLGACRRAALRAFRLRPAAWRRGTSVHRLAQQRIQFGQAPTLASPSTPTSTGKFLPI